MVVDTAGLEALVAEVAAEDAYGFDTEFHTERTYVPDLALIQIAWADKVALVDPLAVDPRPWPPSSAGPAVAVAHAAVAGPRRAHGGLRGHPRHRVRHADRRRVPRHVHPLAVPPGRSDARRLPPEGGPALGLAASGPISERQITYALNDVAHLLELRDVLTERLRALGRLEWALERV